MKKLFNLSIVAAVTFLVSTGAFAQKAGDNIVKVYTSALPSSAYRIGLYDANNNLLAITDFNKL